MEKQILRLWWGHDEPMRRHYAIHEGSAVVGQEKAMQEWLEEGQLQNLLGPKGNVGTLETKGKRQLILVIHSII